MLITKASDIFYQPRELLEVSLVHFTVREVPDGAPEVFITTRGQLNWEAGEGEGEGESITHPRNKEASRLDCLHHRLIDSWDKHVEQQILTDILGNILCALQLLRHFLRHVGEVDTGGKLPMERSPDTDVGSLGEFVKLFLYLKLIFVS